ncbi:MAG: hypothetical protein CSA50_02255 [Gammaproteobacteria bacterium]|nr:MAG: hypothetical protein CSA50_02255 [Gammaproteobacteria bacterium]
MSFEDHGNDLLTRLKREFQHPSFSFSRHEIGGTKGINTVNDERTFFGFAFDVSEKNYLVVII